MPLPMPAPLSFANFPIPIPFPFFLFPISISIYMHMYNLGSATRLIHLIYLISFLAIIHIPISENHRCFPFPFFQPLLLTHERQRRSGSFPLGSPRSETRLGD
ncbi:hypothetical protein CPB84DRAFT_1768011 [Gymnopilus junonius]|uniref:Uncharacterized protein n=1 Tax=Gymnopilus junonius TaxID=109634 RepID=A0A9P5TSL3_GYMJU|nr:hypothetical protein CPB84DRAFT_1768011 [Gymnopilus junonius]